MDALNEMWEDNKLGCIFASVLLSMVAGILVMLAYPLYQNIAFQNPIIVSSPTVVNTPSTPSPTERAIVEFNPTCPLGMILIQGGELFCLDETEVTNEMYYSATGGNKSIPVINVTWHEADRFCTSLNKRLPTKNEYITAIASLPRNITLGIYPSPQPVKSFNPDKNFWGVYDLMGNVREWLATDDNENAYIKGYSFQNNQSLLAEVQPKIFTSNEVGFRCAADILPNP